MSDFLSDVGRQDEPLRSGTVLSVTNGRAKVELATGAVIPSALLVGSASAGSRVRVAYQDGQYVVYGGGAAGSSGVSIGASSSGGTTVVGGTPSPHDWLGAHHTLPVGAAGLFAATPSSSSGTVSLRAIALSDFQSAADARYSLASNTITAGAGLTGGGPIGSAMTINVGVGDGIAADADLVRVRRAATSGLSFSSGGLQIDDSIAGAGLGISSKVLSLADGVAGAGLSINSTTKAISVSAGDGISVTSSPSAVAVRRATTASGLSFASGGLQIDDSIAGNGLTIASKVLAVGAGNGISVASTSVAVNQAYAFTWSAAHTFSANATFSAGLTATRLTGSSNVLALANNTAFQSESFNGGFAGDGWRITRPSGAGTKASFETDNLTVRGSMRVYEMLVNQVRATNGSVLVSSTGKVASASYVLGTPGTPGVAYLFAADDNTAHGFLGGDIILAKRATGTGTYTVAMRVTSSPAPTTTTWQGVLLYADGAIPMTGAEYVGMEFARIGNISNVDRQGTVYLSADDSGAPFMQVSDGVAAWADWNATGKTRVRVGNLNGSYGYTTNLYGFAAGDSAATFVSADVSNGFRIRNNSVSRFSVDTSGNIALRDGAGTQRMALSSAGVIEIDDAAGAARVLIDSGGLKLRDSNGNAAITLDASGNSQFTGVMTIGTSGEIRQGTGSLTASPATYTGLRMWNDAGVGRIAGYNAGALQWSADSDGKLKTAGGQAVWDSSGVLLNSYQGEFPSGSGFTGSYRFGIWSSSAGWTNTDTAGLQHRTGFRLATTTLYNNDVSAYNVISIDASAGSTGTILLKGTDTVTWGTLWFTGTGQQDTNLYRLSANNLKTDDTLIVAGGLNVGSATGAGTGDVRASGGIALNGGALGEAALHSVAPVNQFPASSGSAYEAALRVRGSAGGVASSIVLDISASGAAGAQGGWLQARTSSNYGTFHQLLLNPNGGNVGIGVTSATSRLHVGGDVNSTGVYRVSATQVVGARITGWAAASGTATRTTFATSTVTTAQLAERVKALIDDLTTHGLIGA